MVTIGRWITIKSIPEEWLPATKDYQQKFLTNCKQCPQNISQNSHSCLLLRNSRLCEFPKSHEPASYYLCWIPQFGRNNITTFYLFLQLLLLSFSHQVFENFVECFDHIHHTVPFLPRSIYFPIEPNLLLVPIIPSCEAQIFLFEWHCSDLYLNYKA